MAELIVACVRNMGDHGDLLGDLRRCAEALAPDNITPHPPTLQRHDGLAIAVVNPVPGIGVRDEGVCLGRTFGPAGEWWKTGAEAPDGNFVIVRHDRRRLEVLTDALATRQLWYVHTRDLFAASTSQRALVMLLRSFDLDRETVTWMVAAGHLACRSWDRRLRRVPIDSRVVLDREGWSLQVRERPADRVAREATDAEHIDRVKQAILQVCAELDLPFDEWTLPLSGGLDSRMLLIGLTQAGLKPRCVTWGLRASLLEEDNDAFVARRLAREYGLEHSYWAIDEATDSIETAMRRFISASEGQVCDFAAYTDGMAMWKGFFEDGVAGVIRGDEPGLGYFDRYDSEEQVLRRQETIFVSQYPEDHPIHRLGLVEQQRNERLRRHDDETLQAWSIRMSEESFGPSHMAPLTKVKTGYVEVINPLQSRSVAEAVRHLPDQLRRHRRSLAAVVRELGPDIPLAERSALGRTPPFWVEEAGVSAIDRALSADGAEHVLSRSALGLIRVGLSRPVVAKPARASLAKRVKAAVPRHLVDKLRPVWPLRLGGRELAYRAYLAVCAGELLSRDARLLRGGAPASQRAPVGTAEPR